MLVLKVYVNDKQIDEIHIQNIGHWKNGFYRYVVRKPENKDISCLHLRKRNWKFLVKMILEYLRDDDIVNGKEEWEP